MEYEIQNQKLILKPEGDLNLHKISLCKSLISKQNLNDIVFELSNIRNISSEGIKFFYQLKKEGKLLKLLNKSEVFEESLFILGLQDFFA